MASYYNLSVNYVVWIVNILPGSAAERVGLKMGDIIIKLDGKEIIDIEDLRYKLETSMDKGSSKISLIRKNMELKIKIIPDLREK